MDAPAGLDALVAQMRMLGVSRLKTSDYEIELGAAPLPQHPAHVEPTETADQRVERERKEYESLLFASSESGTPLMAPSLGGHG